MMINIMMSKDTNSKQKAQPGPWEIADSTKHLQDIDIFDVPHPQDLANIRNIQKNQNKKPVASSLYKIFNPKSIPVKNTNPAEPKNTPHRDLKIGLKRAQSSSNNLLLTKSVRANKTNTEANAYSSYTALGNEQLFNQKIIFDGSQQNNKKEQRAETQFKLMKKCKSIKNNTSAGTSEHQTRTRMNSEKSHLLHIYLLNSHIEFGAKKEKQPKTFRLIEMTKQPETRDTTNFFADNDIYKRKEKEELKERRGGLVEARSCKKHNRIFSMEDKWRLDKKHAIFSKAYKDCFQVFPGI